MNQTDSALAGLHRVVSQVRIFRDDPDNLHKGAYCPELTHFLEQRLSAEDWILWQRISIDWESSQ